MSSLNIVIDAKLQTSRTVNQPISAVPSVQNHTKKYISITPPKNLKIWLTSGSQTASVSMPMTSF
jgi:hypothetical protein